MEEYLRDQLLLAHSPVPPERLESYLPSRKKMHFTNLPTLVLGLGLLAVATAIPAQFNHDLPPLGIDLPTIASMKYNQLYMLERDLVTAYDEDSSRESSPLRSGRARMNYSGVLVQIRLSLEDLDPSNPRSDISGSLVGDAARAIHRSLELYRDAVYALSMETEGVVAVKSFLRYADKNDYPGDIVPTEKGRKYTRPKGL
ncbi:MAG: hypothetical protein M1829_003851 [Trizodia sp. TS-e1964]|nr:MAG: hypothetical protein M1829_003851 [Trizodia sp. TS-e1964]